MAQSVRSIRQSYRNIFRGPDGLNVLDDLQARLGGKSHTPGDPYETAFKEGRRDVLLLIQHMLQKEREDNE